MIERALTGPGRARAEAPGGLLGFLARLGTSITIETSPEEFVFTSPRGVFRAHPILYLSAPDARGKLLGVGAEPPANGVACYVSVWSPPMYPGFARSQRELIELFLRHGIRSVMSPRALLNPRVFFPDVTRLLAVVPDPRTLLLEPALRAGARSVVFDRHPEDLG